MFDELDSVLTENTFNDCLFISHTLAAMISFRFSSPSFSPSLLLHFDCSAV